MVIGRLIFVDIYKFSIHIFFLQNFQAVFAIFILSDGADEGGGETKPRGGNGGVGTVANGRNNRNAFIRDFVAETKAYLAGEGVNLAVNMGILDVDKSIDNNIANREEINFFHNKIIARSLLRVWKLYLAQIQ